MIPPPAFSTTTGNDTYTHDDYFRVLAETGEKYEYINGEIVPMAGGKFNHDQLGIRLIVLLSNQLLGRCAVSSAAQLLYIEAANRYTFADVSVTCATPNFVQSRDGKDAITNPSLIVEVLSESTEAEDRGKKFRDYKKLPSLQTYLLVAQDERRIECFNRQPNGTWVVDEIDQSGDILQLPSIGCTLALDAVYERVNF